MNIIDYLQTRSNKTRNRLMWSASAMAACVVVSLWFINFKQNLKQLSGADLIDFQTEEHITSDYVTLESAEIKDNRTYLYFSVQNPSSDILNFATSGNISLTINKDTFIPVAITNRQGQAFVQKLLSNSQNFGILVFDKPLAGEGELSFDNLYFEQNVQTIFKEQVSLDFSKLSKPLNIGN